MRELDFRILESMNLKVGRVRKAYGAYICETQDGIKLVKEMQCPVADVLFAYKVKEYLYYQGYRNTDRYCITEEGLPYIQEGSIRYTVRNWIRGDELDLKNLKEVTSVMAEAAQLHLLGKGMPEPEGFEGKRRWFEPGERLLRSQRLIRSYYKNVRKQGRYTDFDLLFLKEFAYYEEQTVHAAEMMQETICIQEAENAGKTGNLIHGEFTDHAVLSDQKQMLLCNFDKCCYGMPVQDLITFFEKCLRKWEWDFAVFIQLIEMYQRYRTLHSGEIRILYAGLLFPERFVKMCQDAYGTKRRWTSQANWNKLLEIREMQEKREEFLLQFRRYFQI